MVTFHPEALGTPAGTSIAKSQCHFFPSTVISVSAMEIPSFCLLRPKILFSFTFYFSPSHKLHLLKTYSESDQFLTTRISSIVVQIVIFYLNYCNTLLIVLSPFSIYSLENPKESCILPFPLYTPQLSSLSPLFACLAILQTLIFLRFTKHFKVSSLFFLYLEIFARRQLHVSASHFSFSATPLLTPV